VPTEAPKLASKAPSTTNSSLRTLAREIAREHGLNEEEFLRVLDCENRGWDPSIQSYHRYKEGNRWGFPAGTREKSYGLVMIHLPDHPSVTYEQATDPVYALNWMADKWVQGRQAMWSCY